MEEQLESHVVVVLDRSGSMGSVRDDAIGGFNVFVDEQRKLPGEARLTLVQFDGKYDVVYSGVPLAEVPRLTAETYVPRGSTALYDAIGRAVAEATEARRKTPSGGLEHVIVAILTDGEENASRELDGPAVKALLERKKAEGFSFVFLAADVDLERATRTMGISADDAASFSKSSVGTSSAFRDMSRRVGTKRSLPPPGDAGGTSDTTLDPRRRRH